MSSSTHPQRHPPGPAGPGGPAGPAGAGGPAGPAGAGGDRPDLVMAVMGASHRLGGSERGTIETAAADAARGQQWLIVLRDTGPGEAIRLCADLGVELVLVRSTCAVHRLVRDRRPTIVYVFGPRWSVPLRLVMGPSRLAAHLARVVGRGRGHGHRHGGGARPRFVVAQRGLDVWRKPWHRWADRFTHWLVDRYIANSQAAADMLVHQVGIPAAKVSVLRTGLGDQWLTPPAEPRQRPGHPPHVVMVGNDRPEKALDDAIAALATVADLDWRATIYTDVADRLAGIIDAAGVGERIDIVAGHRLAPADLDAADLLLQTSVAESLPRAVLEAVARGVRVLASDVGDTATIVPAAQVFPAGDRAAAAALLRTWLDDAASRPAEPAGSGRSGAESVGPAADRGVTDAASSPWARAQPVTVAHELDVADSLCRLAHEPVR